MTRHAFVARIRPLGPRGGHSYVEVPTAVALRWGEGARVPVRGTFQGIAFSGSVLPDGEGEHWLQVNPSTLRAAGLGAGDEVALELEPDPRRATVEAPNDLADALVGDNGAREAWTRLAPSQKRAYVAWLDGAKKPETRARRASRAPGLLREGVKRPR